jgi:hypothetical protein
MSTELCYTPNMPTVLRVGPYRFFFYSSDSIEPYHVRRDRQTAKFWLSPVRLGRSGGFSRQEINQIQRLVEENQSMLMREWDEYFDN